MKKIMKRAHELAKEMEGDYRARMSLALRQAWREEKEESKEMKKERVKVTHVIDKGWVEVKGREVTDKLITKGSLEDHNSKFCGMINNAFGVYEIDKPQ